MSPYRRILVPLDGSATAERGLREAIALAARTGARLRLLHVIDAHPLFVGAGSAPGADDPMQGLRVHATGLLGKAQIQAAAAGVAADPAVRELTSERIGDVITDEARAADCDLIVMGTHGRRGFSRIALGSAAESVARSSPVPVLLMRALP